VADALDDLYTPVQQQQWKQRYVLSCRRTKRAMAFYALKEAGYPTKGYL
jgi:hypothetical protein